MSKDTSKEDVTIEEKKVNTELTKKLTKEELKEKFRKIQLEYSGRLTIDDKYKKPGKVLRIDNDDLATRKMMATLGYTPVLDPVEVGSGGLHQSHNIGSEVHIEQGIVHTQPGILYECDSDVYEARKEVEAEANQAQLDQTISEAQYSELQDKFKRISTNRL